MTSKTSLLILLAMLGLAPAQSFSQPATTPLSIERSAAMKTRDGVELRADIYRPVGEGSYPVLLERTPYGKDAAFAFARRAAERGYIVVVQDVRGRFASEGEWRPFQNERLDGYDAVEWAAALPHANGKVGMYGGSYPGYAQLMAAVARPPHLTAIAPVVAASNPHGNWIYHGGAFELWSAESWTSMMAIDTYTRWLRRSASTPAGSAQLPLKQYPVLSAQDAPGSPNFAAKTAPYFADWLNHPSYDSYWQPLALENFYEQIQVPALHITAWYDSFLGGSLRNYVGLRTRAGSEAARQGQRLIVAIGGHAGQGRKIGGADFGPAAEEYDEEALVLDWFDYQLKGESNRLASSKPVRIFVMGENRWREEDAWPLERAHATRLFLHSGGRANTAAGDGALSPTAPQKEPADKFVYDPANPVPTTGGPLCCDNGLQEAGPRDQRKVEARKDVLVFTSEALNEALEVTGPVKLELWAASSAPDTDFTAKLVDVAPNGAARNLTEGVYRTRYRESAQNASKPLVKDKPYRFTVDLWATSNVFLKGHRIRLEVSSSNFPRFDRNLNTGKNQATGTEFVKATNSVLHDAAHPSALLLPVVPHETDEK
jgi:putative CocE/NonD family hydrolase